jgi:hypothetical protein
MIRFVLVFFLSLNFLHASKILSYNIYDRTDRADVMLTFDTPYEGIIKQSVTKTKIIIKLEGASIESSRVKKVSSKFLHSITITPLKNQVHIVASVPQGTKLVASKTADAYGLRLRFTKKTVTKKTSSQASGISIKYLVISGCVTVIGPPFLICSLNLGITLPLLPSTLPNLTATISVLHLVF